MPAVPKRLVLEAPVEAGAPKVNDILECCRDQSEPASLGLGEKATETGR